MRSLCRWLTLAVAGLSLAAPADETARRVFAHYMVCIPTYGGSSKIEDYQREIRAAQAAGLDGFALNCGGWTRREPHYKQRTLLLYQAAQELGTDFQLFISADYATGLTSEETRDMVETFRHHPNQFRHDGKPVLSTFAGGCPQTEFVRGEFVGDRAIVYVPFYYPEPAAEMPKQAQVDQVFRDHNPLDGFSTLAPPARPRRSPRATVCWRGGGWGQAKSSWRASRPATAAWAATTAFMNRVGSRDWPSSGRGRSGTRRPEWRS